MKQIEETTKSGIPEFDNIIMEYQAGDISFQALCDRLWNTGYKYGRKEAEPPAVLSRLLQQIEELPRYGRVNGQKEADAYKIEDVKALIKQHLSD